LWIILGFFLIFIYYLILIFLISNKKTFRVIVLDQGKIVEMDTPDQLIKNKKSIFYSMCKDAGLV